METAEQAKKFQEELHHRSKNQLQNEFTRRENFRSTFKTLNVNTRMNSSSTEHDGLGLTLLAPLTNSIQSGSLGKRAQKLSRPKKFSVSSRREQITKLNEKKRELKQSDIVDINDIYKELGEMTYDMGLYEESISFLLKSCRKTNIDDKLIGKIPGLKII